MHFSLSLEKPSADLPNVAQAPLQTSARTARWRHSTQRRAITQAAQLGNIRVRPSDLVCPCCTTPSRAFSRPWKVSLLQPLSHFLPLSTASLFSHVPCEPQSQPACPAVIRDKLPALCLLSKAAITGKAWSGAACPRLARRESLAGDGQHPALPPQGACGKEPCPL